MSIGIAVTLPGAVLLVSDSRRTLPLVPDAPPDDGVEKIRLIGANLGVIEFGVAYATEVAVTCLSAKLIARPNNFVEALDECISAGWNSFVAALAPDVDRTHRAVRAALVSGGFDAGGIFIAGVLRDFATPNPTVVRRNLFNFIVLGGEELAAERDFNRRATAAIRRVDRKDADSLHPIGEYMLEAAHETIRYVSRLDTTVGGSTRYAFLTANRPPRTGVVSNK